MSCLSRVSSYAAVVLSKTGTTAQILPRAAAYQCHVPLFNSVRATNLELGFSRFRIKQWFSSKPAKSKHKSRPKPYPSVTMERQPHEKKDEEEDGSLSSSSSSEFFVVRKGDVVGVYKSFSDCLAQVGSSINDPPVSIFKGYSLPSDSEAYLRSHGLHNALYSIRASDLKDDLFGTLVPCPFQLPASSEGETFSKDLTKKRSLEALGVEIEEMDSSTWMLGKHVKLDSEIKSQAEQSVSGYSLWMQAQQKRSCTLEFDGASKGNPGQGGAGAVLRASDGTLICRLREGLGTVTCNAAEYRAVILGLKYALRIGYTKICVKGDSKLVCLQMQGLWKVKNENLSKLYKEARKLKDRFHSFQIDHVLREFNSEADAQANLAVQLADGQVQEVVE